MISPVCRKYLPSFHKKGKLLCDLFVDVAKMPGKVGFDKKWLQDENFKDWIAEMPDKHQAWCKVCMKKIEIGAMGVRALKSHMNPRDPSK